MLLVIAWIVIMVWIVARWDAVDREKMLDPTVAEKWVTKTYAYAPSGRRNAAGPLSRIQRGAA